MPLYAAGFGNLRFLQHRPGRAGVPDAVDGEVIVPVDVAVVIEIAVEVTPDRPRLREVRIDLEVIVAVEGSVGVGVAGVGVLDDDAGRVNGLAIIELRVSAGE